jgi:hypothetical protein
MTMNWGKTFALIGATLLLAGCSGAPAEVGKPSSSSAPSLVVKSQTGDPVADKLIAILKASCAYAKANGLIIDDGKETWYTFPQANEFAYEEYWNNLIDSNGKYSINGYPDGDPVCDEAVYTQGVVAIGSPKNADGIVFDYKLKVINETTFDWNVFRGSSKRSFVRITIKDNLVSGLKSKGEYDLKVAYGPFSSKIVAAHQKALIAENLQYMPLASHVHGMKVAEARAFLKKNGLTLLIAMQDAVDFYPSGPPQGKSDPKRIMVNVQGGTIVGVWTM